MHRYASSTFLPFIVSLPLRPSLFGRCIDSITYRITKFDLACFDFFFGFLIQADDKGICQVLVFKVCFRNVDRIVLRVLPYTLETLLELTNRRAIECR
jgi:hypothetical protein